MMKFTILSSAAAVASAVPKFTRSASTGGPTWTRPLRTLSASKRHTKEENKKAARRAAAWKKQQKEWKLEQEKHAVNDIVAGNVHVIDNKCREKGGYCGPKLQLTAENKKELQNTVEAAHKKDVTGQTEFIEKNKVIHDGEEMIQIDLNEDEESIEKIVDYVKKQACTEGEESKECKNIKGKLDSEGKVLYLKEADLIKARENIYEDFKALADNAEEVKPVKMEEEKEE